MKIQILICAIAATFTVAAQENNLNKEIVIEKDYVPIEQKAVRITLAPEVVKFEPAASELLFSNRNEPIEGPNAIATLVPYGYRTSTVFQSPKAYLEYALGSYMNMNGAAGARLLNKKNTKLGLWLRHQSSWGMKNDMVYEHYQQQPEFHDKDFNFTQRFSDDRGGLLLSQKTATGIFHAGLSYRHGRTALANITNLFYPVCKFSNFNSINANAEYSGSTRSGKYTYHASAAFTTTKIGEGSYYNPSSEILVGIKGGVAHKVGEIGHVGVDARFDMRGISYFDATEPYESGFLNTNHCWLNLHPFYSGQTGSLRYKIGLNVDMNFDEDKYPHILNSEKERFLKLSPMISANYRIHKAVSIYANATGGRHYNTFMSLYDANRQSSFSTAYNSSYTNIDARAGVRVGPVRGFAMNIFGGYGDISGALLQAKLRYAEYGLHYCRRNTAGFMWGAGMSYHFYEIISAEVDVMNAPQSELGNGYDTGADRPEWMLNATVNINPIDKLQLDLGFRMSTNRMIRYEYPAEVTCRCGDAITRSSIAYCNLKNAYNLYFNASYRIKPWVAVSVNASNLLNCHYMLSPYYAAQRLGVMAGLHFYLY